MDTATQVGPVGQTQDHSEKSLIGLPIDEARYRKWLRGVVEHGPIMALDPLDEMFAEFCDSINYGEQLAVDPRLSGFSAEAIASMVGQLRIMARTLQIVKAGVVPYIPAEQVYR